MKIYFPLFILIILISNFKWVSAFSSKHCEFKEDCPDLHVCSSDRYCIHKPLFPMTIREILGATILVIFVGFANAGGSGGGPIMIPIVIAFFNYSLKDSFFTCELLSLGGSMGNFLSLFRVRHQATNGPLVNYNLIMLTLPMLVIGEIFGYLMKNYLPSGVLLLILVCVLLKSIKRCFDRLKILKATEKDELKAFYRCRTEYDNSMFHEDFPKMISNYPLCKNFVEERKLFPFKKLLLILFIILLSFSMTSLRGSKKFQSPFNFQYCGIGYWETYLMVLFVNSFVAYKVGKNLKKLTERMREFSERVMSVYFEENNIKSFMRNGFEGGFFGGMLGIGCGVILAPFWFKSGILPLEATATSILCVIIASIISNSQVFYSSDLDYVQWSFFLLISFTSSHLIASIIKKFIQRNNRQSILVYILFAKMVISVCFLPILTIHRLLDEEEPFFEFKALC